MREYLCKERNTNNHKLVKIIGSVVEVHDVTIVKSNSIVMDVLTSTHPHCEKGKSAVYLTDIAKETIPNFNVVNDTVQQEKHTKGGKMVGKIPTKEQDLHLMK